MKDLEKKMRQGHESYLHGHAAAALVSGLLLLAALVLAKDI